MTVNFSGFSPGEVVLLGICVGRGHVARCDVSRWDLGVRCVVRSVIGVSPNLIGERSYRRNV